MDAGPPPLARQAYIDWARGLAVLLMIEAHTLDAWTVRTARRGPLFRDATVLGGFAAPLFLLLAGMAVVLSATRQYERTGNRRAAVEGVCRRGIEIFLLAFLFRLQAFVISPGSYPVSLFRVDILNIMGPAVAGAGLVWGLTANRVALVGSYAALALVCAMATPIVRASPLVDALPVWVQWYVRPAGDYTTFTLFPWAGFVFAGGACGVFLARAHDAWSERRVQAGLGAAGAALVALGSYTAGLPSLYRTSSFWTSSPTWFLMRVGILLFALAALYAVSRVLTCRPLERFGRNSLFIYWIHVELVYGYVTWLIHGRLPLWGTALGFAIFSVVMYGAIGVRERLEDTWRGRGLVKYPKPVLP